MKLYTDAGNFQALKIFISAEIAKEKLEFQEVKHEARVVPYMSSHKLPVLEVYPEKFIFSSNAAARLILARSVTEENPSAVDQWLDWESACLLPAVFPYLQSVIVQGKMDESLVQGIQKFLAFLDGELKGKEMLTGSQLTVADVAVWSTLFPVFTGKSALPGYQSHFPILLTWFTKLANQGEFQRVSQAMCKGGDTSSLKGSLTIQPTPLRVAETANQKEAVQKQTSKAKEDTTQAAPEKIVASPEEIQAATLAWLKGKKLCPEPLKRVHPVLPEKGRRNILITSALPYVNNVPHLGNIIGCVLSADVFSRYCRLRNYNVLYICGTDEYGTATETKAIAEGLTPQQICDKYSALHRDIYKWFNIDFDYFGRTTTEQQKVIAQDIFWHLHKNGYVLTNSVEQLHCENCDRFLADRFAEGTCPMCKYDDARGDQCDACGKLINAVELINPKCKLCGNRPKVRSSEHLFLDLPKAEPKLQVHLDSVFQTGLWTNNAKVITKSWIRDGLKPRCISRDLKWGIPVPLEGFTDKVFYVWFDAPIGYISITANYTEHWAHWWKNPEHVQLYNFLGKDNVPFHSVIFPASLLGADDHYTVVGHMSATEYLNYEDGKFSKSRGTGVFGDQARDTGIPADIYRFYLLYVRPETQDSSFSWDDLFLKNNSELLNNLGNFINRALMFVSNSFGGSIQQMDLSADDFNLIALVTRELRSYIDNMENARIRDSIRNVLSISRLGNQFMQENKPWVLVKGSDIEKSRAGTVVSLAANLACLLSVLLHPYMPEVSATIQCQLNAPQSCNVVYEDFVCHLDPGHKIGQPSPLFQKIESSTIAELKKRFAGQGPAAPSKPKPKKGGEPSQNSQTATSPAEVERLQGEVTSQANKVRDLKAKKAEKGVIDAEVKILLDLKKQLADAQVPSAVTETGGGKNKGEKGDQPAVKQEVKVTANNVTSSPAEVERLNKLVTEQGNKVRELKTTKAEKALVDTEVSKLLDLKHQLALAQGENPDASPAGGKQKGKKK
ncbi:methionine--tRNA ligase, cytoplasmic-like isoform X4 [Dreissena polymorpha]|uniref:methionine--tRNA ligase, cytoplasmic-like isoform X4 n=1 Tax=Dreissena polymorpha TaxID=45954 RepID=UPI002264B5D3|nr:methionine--tRNA ligase, cytoplasmic-like isoform X4 [Dreissena polymorpha]